MKLKILYFLIILCSVGPWAQAQFTEGFIIDQNGDRYDGYLRIKKDREMQGKKLSDTETLIFKESENGKKETLGVSDLKAFQIGKDSFLVLNNLQLPSEKAKYNRFARVLLSSKAGVLCTFDDSKATSGGAGMTYAVKTKTRYLILRGGKYTVFNTSNFYKEIQVLVADDAELKKKITSKQLHFSDIEQIAEQYESWQRNGKS